MSELLPKNPTPEQLRAMAESMERSLGSAQDAGLQAIAAYIGGDKQPFRKRKLYSLEDIDAAVAAERERCIERCRAVAGATVSAHVGEAWCAAAMACAAAISKEIPPKE